MGADLWHHAIPWHPDPAEALLDFQTRFLVETYDLPSLLQEHLKSLREAVRITEAEDDEYGLLATYRDELAMLEEVAGSPLPEAPRGQIELVRKIFEGSGEGVGNILDVVGVSNSRDYPTAELLAEEDVDRLFGTTHPTLSQARRAVGEINGELRRGESVCFPYYEESDAEQPAGWYFVGNTID